MAKFCVTSEIGMLPQSVSWGCKRQESQGSVRCRKNTCAAAAATGLSLLSLAVTVESY